MFLGALGNDGYSATLTAGSGATYRLGGGGGTLTLNNTNALTGANAVIIGASGLTGTVVIPAANNYTGTTTLAAGTLAVGNNGALGTGTLALNGGTIQPTRRADYARQPDQSWRQFHNRGIGQSHLHGRWTVDRQSNDHGQRPRRGDVRRHNLRDWRAGES